MPVEVESSTNPASGRVFRDHWEWSILFLPVAAFLLLLMSQLWITDGMAQAIAPPVTGAEDVGEFARGFLQISAVTLVYVLICLAAILYFWREVQAAASADLSAGRRRAVGACCAAIGVFGAALAVIHTFLPSFFAISRITLEPTIGAYGAATDAIGITRLHGQLLAFAPNLAGVAAAVMGSFHAALVTTRAVAKADRAADGNGAVPGGVPASLLNGMVVLSVVLVVSVLLVTLHVHVHGPLYGAGASAQAEFANFVSVVWGIGLSLLAALIYVPHLVLLGVAGWSALAGVGAADGANGPRGASLFQKVEMALAIFGPLIIAVLAAGTGPVAQCRGWLTQPRGVPTGTTRTPRGLQSYRRVAPPRSGTWIVETGEETGEAVGREGGNKDPVLGLPRPTRRFGIIVDRCYPGRRQHRLCLILRPKLPSHRVSRNPMAPLRFAQAAAPTRVSAIGETLADSACADPPAYSPPLSPCAPMSSLGISGGRSSSVFASCFLGRPTSKRSASDSTKRTAIAAIQSTLHPRRGRAEAADGPVPVRRPKIPHAVLEEEVPQPEIGEFALGLSGGAEPPLPEQGVAGIVRQGGAASAHRVDRESGGAVPAVVGFQQHLSLAIQPYALRLAGGRGEADQVGGQRELDRAGEDPLCTGAGVVSLSAGRPPGAQLVEVPAVIDRERRSAVVERPPLFVGHHANPLVPETCSEARKQPRWRTGPLGP